MTLNDIHSLLPLHIKTSRHRGVRFCDKEMAETKAKREDKQDEVDDLTTKIDKAPRARASSAPGALLTLCSVKKCLTDTM